MPQDLCRVCLKRPEIPDETHGRCDVCVKSHRVAYRFRLGLEPTGHTYIVKSGELSPRALKQKWHAQLLGFSGTPTMKSHLPIHEVELVVTKEKIDTLRFAQDLESHSGELLPLLLQAAERSDASW